MKHLVLLCLIIMLLGFSGLNNQSEVVWAQEFQINEVLSSSQPIHTVSRFETKLETLTKKIDKEEKILDDPSRELDEDLVLDEGKDGTLTQVIKTYFYEGKEYSKDIISQELIEQKPKIISHGTKIVWKQLDTPDGQISYWRKLHVFATSYDSHCLGCDETTATGLKQGKGVIAVDPHVIKLESKLYIPGYGVAVAGDTGGAINGNVIDLGFDNVSSSGWHAHFIDIYLLDQEPPPK